MPLAGLDDLVFGAWDPFPDDAYVAAAARRRARPARHIEPIADALRAVRPMPAVFDRSVRQAPRRPTTSSGTVDKRAMLEAIREDIRRFQRREAGRPARDGLVPRRPRSSSSPARRTSTSRRSRRRSTPTTRRSPRRCSTPTPRCWRASRSPTARRTSPSTSRRCVELATDRGVPISRQGLQDRPDADEDRARADAQGAHARACPAGTRRTSSATATARCSTTRRASRPRRSRSSACSSTSSQPERYPELYGDIYHKVRINYYPPRGDNKEGWDNIDIFGWLGYPMQIKVDFLCRDSILAAPLVLDLALFLDLAQRAGMSGIQEWLSFYFKSPQTRARPLPRARPVHPADEAEEHAALDDGRGADHPPRPRVLRYGRRPARRAACRTTRRRLPRRRGDRQSVTTWSTVVVGLDGEVGDELLGEAGADRHAVRAQAGQEAVEVAAALAEPAAVGA